MLEMCFAVGVPLPLFVPLFASAVGQAMELGLFDYLKCYILAHTLSLKICNSDFHS